MDNGLDEEENQLDATQYFIALVIGSTCFWHHCGWLSVQAEDCCSIPQPEHLASHPAPNR
jgi:hypothetical protein